MFYEFPIINDIEQVRNAIQNRSEFIEADKGEYIVFNYLVNFEDTFPLVTDENSALLRECRGLIFDKETRKVIGRRYHKFFNLNEKAETQLNKIDWSIPHVILEKLDGSMITPFYTSDGILHIGTKMGETDVALNAKNWIEKNPSYAAFIKYMNFEELTPIFEWCSRKNRIVVDYPEDRLVLTGIRDNVTGEYVEYSKMYYEAASRSVECIKKIPAGFIEEIIDRASRLENEEGYIVRFENGHMLKVKGAWYLQMHKTMEHIQLEKDLIRLILEEKLDDAKPFLPSDLVSKIDEFGHEMFQNIYDYSVNIAWESIELFDNVNSKKQFAEKIKDKSEQQIRFKLFDFIENCDNEGEIIEFARKLVTEKIKSNLSTQTKVNSVRHLFGDIKWE